MRDLTFMVRNGRGRLVGRSEPRDLRGFGHIRIKLRRQRERGRRYMIVATGRRPDGSQAKQRGAVRLRRG